MQFISATNFKGSKGLFPETKREEWISTEQRKMIVIEEKAPNNESITLIAMSTIAKVSIEYRISHTPCK